MERINILDANLPLNSLSKCSSNLIFKEEVSFETDKIILKFVLTKQMHQMVKKI